MCGHNVAPQAEVDKEPDRRVPGVVLGAALCCLPVRRLVPTCQFCGRTCLFKHA